MSSPLCRARCLPRPQGQKATGSGPSASTPQTGLRRPDHTQRASYCTSVTQGVIFDGAQRSICCSSLKTNKKQILRSAQDDMLGGFFSSLLGWFLVTRTCATNLPYQGTTSVVPEGGAASTRALAPAPPAAKVATPFAVVLARLGEEGRLVR